MSRTKQLWLIVAVVLAITSATSHIVARAVHIRLQAVSPLSFGETNLPVETIAAGSSLMFYGINWPEVARASGIRVQGWAVPAGSVVEMEVLQAQAPAAQITFLGIGMSDLNENYLSDYRAEIVPLWQNLNQLWSSRAEPALARRALSQYPLKYFRALYPTAGRSMHVLVGMRETLRKLRRGRTAAAPGEQAILSSDANTHEENITTWPEDRRLRNIGLIRESAGGYFAFRGPKREALFRFLKRGAAQGKMVVVVIPESPSYQQEFLNAATRSRFEELLTEAQQQVPQALWIRLDASPELSADENYWDLVHLNAAGQARATKIVRAQLAAAGVF